MELQKRKNVLERKIVQLMTRVKNLDYMGKVQSAGTTFYTHKWKLISHLSI